MYSLSHLQPNRKTTAAPRPLGIALYGIDRSLKNPLQFFFSARCRNHFYIEPERSHADIVIIDFDSRKGQKIWQRHLEHYPNRPAILLSLTGAAIQGAQVVSKPLRVPALQQALDNGRKQLQQRKSAVLRLPTARARTQEKPSPQPTVAAAAPRPVPQEKTTKPPQAQNRLPSGKTRKNSVSLGSFKGLDEKISHTFIGSAPDIDPGNPLQLRSAQYDPTNFLVYRVSQAIRLAEEKGQAVSLKQDRGSITLFPGDRRALVWMQERHLRSLAALPVDDGKLTASILDIGPDSALAKSDPQSGLDALLWRLTLIACRGRFPVGTDPHAPVVLKHWPNLTRLQSFPHAVRIANLWAHESVSLLETAKILDIPQRYVFTFYSAANMTGLAAAVTRKPESAPVQSAPVRRHGKRRLLTRIIQHLRLAS